MGRFWRPDRGQRRASTGRVRLWVPGMRCGWRCPCREGSGWRPPPPPVLTGQCGWAEHTHPASVPHSRWPVGQGRPSGSSGRCSRHPRPVLPQPPPPHPLVLLSQLCLHLLSLRPRHLGTELLSCCIFSHRTKRAKITWPTSSRIRTRTRIRRSSSPSSCPSWGTSPRTTTNRATERRPALGGASEPSPPEAS